MLTYYPYAQHGHVNHGWLDSHFHFSFAEYYNPKRQHFGVLRVVNDDWIEPQNGFDLHGHRDMEIISYVIEGSLTHGDTLGHEQTLQAGMLQYMSAGHGIEHREHNLGTVPTRILQIWVYPERKGLTPQYGQIEPPREAQLNGWQQLVGPKADGAPITLAQDVQMAVTQLQAGKTLTYELAANRQAYCIQVNGDALVNEQQALHRGDGLEAVGEPLTFHALSDTHLFIIEMARES